MNYFSNCPGSRTKFTFITKTMKKYFLLVFLILFLQSLFGQAQDNPFAKQMTGFDDYMEQILTDWNAPGIGVGIVYKDRLVFAKGYGYRDYEKKLPVTANTMFQIASNTKLFTATAVGFLVEERRLDWDQPVKNYVPSIQFYNNELNNTVTIRDMLAHRTGISRHDLIWYKSDFTRKELFDRLKYLEPSQPLRQGFIYNNLMYCASGYITELLSGKSWESYVKEKIFDPLEMSSSTFTIQDMLKLPDYFVPYNEKRDTTLLYKIPYYEDQAAIGPAGAIVSNINDLSKWLIAQLNGGMYKGKQAIPENIIRATLTPAIALDNSISIQKGYLELLGSSYGMARNVASYRGHLISYHGGDINGIHSQVSIMPVDSIGVIVFTIGDHTSSLYNTVTFNIYERLLGMSQTPWSERRLKDRVEGKAVDKQGRSQAGFDKVPDTNPSHKLEDYAGEFEHPAYGIIHITLKDQQLHFDFHNIKLPLSHYHYNRFDTPNDEEYGQWTLNYLTNPQGEIDKIVLSLDESEVTFTRKPDDSMTNPEVLAKYVGKYELAGGILEIALNENNTLEVIMPGQPKYELVAYKNDQFRLKQFSDLVVKFVNENNSISGFDLMQPSGIYRYTRK